MSFRSVELQISHSKTPDITKIFHERNSNQENFQFYNNIETKKNLENSLNQVITAEKTDKKNINNFKNNDSNKKDKRDSESKKKKNKNNISKIKNSRGSYIDVKV